MRWWLLRLINGKIFIILRLTVNFFLLFWLFWLCHDKLISPLRLWYSYDLPPPTLHWQSIFYTLLSTLCWRRLTPSVPIDIHVISPESYAPPFFDGWPLKDIERKLKYIQVILDYDRSSWLRPQNIINHWFSFAVIGRWKYFLINFFCHWSGWSISLGRSR